MPDSDMQKEMETARFLLEKGRMFEAINLYTEVLSKTPRQTDALFMLAALSHKMGQMESALSFLHALLEEEPKNAKAWVLRAEAHRFRGDYNEAVISAKQAVKYEPQLEDGWVVGGRALLQAGSVAEASELLKLAHERFPDSAAVGGLCALVQSSAGALPEAYKLARRIEAQAPDNADALIAEIGALVTAGQYARVIARCREAVKNFPQLAAWLAHVAGSSMLLTGDYEQGYSVLSAVSTDRYRASPVPEWNGAPSVRRHLVLYGEQGFSDILQFVRFVPRATTRAGRVTLRVPVQMERLFKTSMPKQALAVYTPTTSRRRPLAQDFVSDPLAEFPPDAEQRASLINLPMLLKLGGQTDANLVPYIKADQQGMARAAAKLVAVPRPRMGFVWFGAPRHGNDHARSMPFAACKPLVEAFRSHIVALQIGKEGARAVVTAGLTDYVSGIRDFADTAALIANLDVVVTVDTAVAHLAGAMGVPVWVMLPFSPDWCWQLGRDDSPWYPTARLFRQNRPGAWDGVIARVAADFQRLVEGDRSVLTPPPSASGAVLTRHPLAIALPES